MQTVIETASYLAQVEKLGLAGSERARIVKYFAASPDAGEIMKGTGGARKTRIAGRSKGKSGGYRVITFYAAEDIPVFLLDIYSKDEKDNLTEAERNEVKKYLGGLADDYRKNISTKVAALKQRYAERGNE